VQTTREWGSRKGGTGAKVGDGGETKGALHPRHCVLDFGVLRYSLCMRHCGWCTATGGAVGPIIKSPGWGSMRS
jgi:hypothetical protein